MSLVIPQSLCCPVTPGSLLALLDSTIGGQSAPLPQPLFGILILPHVSFHGVSYCLFALHFSLPTVTNLLQSVEEGTYKSDSNFQEMFYNFLLHPSSQVFTGVDITHIRTTESWEAERTRQSERFCQNYFGQTDSPGRSLQMSIKGKQIAYGNRRTQTIPTTGRM